MKLLADENIHARIVGWLRDQGHDVVWATKSLRGQADAKLLDLADREQRMSSRPTSTSANWFFNNAWHIPGLFLLGSNSYKLTSVWRDFTLFGGLSKRMRLAISLL